ncbi:PR domain zinc finger protein 5 [Microdochium nivale]|nr:PR domain zinc finger protein 5 [Microdochium nivale]
MATSTKPHICTSCTKAFATKAGRDQHMDDTHNNPHACPRCCQAFYTGQDRDQHMSSTNIDKPHKCYKCCKSFATTAGLTTHAADKGHANSHGVANKSSSSGLKSGGTLATPASNSAAAPKRFGCDSCVRIFATKQAMEQHMRDMKHGRPLSGQHGTKSVATAGALANPAAATRHADAVSETGASSDTSTSGILLTPTSSSAASQAAEQHVGDIGRRHEDMEDGSPDSILGSPRTWSFVSADEGIDTPEKDNDNDNKMAPRGLVSAMDNLALSTSSNNDDDDDDAQETPLDRFFGSFTGPDGFAYDRHAPPSVSFAQLKNHLGFSQGQPEMQVLRRRFHVAIDNELDEHYGARNDLAAWQTLHGIVLTGEPGRSITACKKAIQSIHLNIFDLVAFARRAPASEGKAQQPAHIKIFPSTKALKKYSRAQNKIFPLVGGAKLNGDQSAGLAAFLRYFGGPRNVSY